MNSNSLEAALAAQRYETARRIGLKLIGDPASCTASNLFLLHDAYVALADFQAARALLDSHSEAFKEERFRVALKLAHDLHILAQGGHYRLSEEEQAGYSIDEYIMKYRVLSAKQFAEAEETAISPEQKSELESLRIRLKLQTSPSSSGATRPVRRRQGNSVVRGRVLLPDGIPAASVVVTLGLRTEVRHVNPATYCVPAMHYAPEIGPVETLTADTDIDGAFRIESVPPGVHDFIAVTLDPERWEIATRFLARQIDVPENASVELGDLRIAEWQSAPSVPVVSAHPECRSVAGVPWRKVNEWTLRNPFHYAFRRQLVRFALPASFDSTVPLRVEVVPGKAELFQISDNAIAVMVDLPARTDRSVALFAGEMMDMPVPSSLRRAVTGDADCPVWEIDTGAARFRVAGEGGDPGLAPIQAVQGAHGIWRGEGRLILPQGISVVARSAEVLEDGPLFLRLLLAYTLSNGGSYSLELTAISGEPYLSVRECSDELEGASFEFSLREFSGGRAFLHWTPEAGGEHWSTLYPRCAEIARLPESVPWWIPPQGFGCAMTPAGLEQNDYIAVVSLRRGEWIDRKFERIANGPLDRAGQENWELDWPYPEMVGSSISMITARTDETGDAYFRFGMFEGERRWGLVVSTLERNDGPHKEISAIQHANSSPRLQDFKDWHFDEPDRISRPRVITRRETLPALRRKSRHPRFARLWSKILGGNVPGPSQGLAFALNGDPALAWKKRIELLCVAEVRARMSLLGRDFSDIYSPVGGRPITQWAEEYDLLAACGLFSPEEERDLRAFFILMGHLFMESDFMNWKFNSRNANFEADRVDVVAAIGLVFDGHPDAPKFLEHAVERTRKSLAIYCTPGSGKWYENPACYYLHASKCRMNLVFHLVNHGRLDISEISRLKEYLRWGVVLLTPPQPVSYAVMRDGDAEMYEKAEKVRKVPPIGDHAGLGRWLPEYYFFMGKLFLASDPDFGSELMDAYFLSSGDGCRLLDAHSGIIDQEGENPFKKTDRGSSFGNLPLLFTSIEEADLPTDPRIELVSRRLEGFGAVLRCRVNTPEEDYLLVKQGPGGYRYHRTEGSFLLFSKGRPLIYDGGEAGETWRHSTLSFHGVHMPMAAGRVERFFSNPRFHFVQGVHPEVIQPGQPVYLSDQCDHTLVEECYRRFEKKDPAVVRAFAWVGGDYLVIHDALDLDPAVSSHWHLQVVGKHRAGWGGEYDFTGRFGVDLQVILPGQSFASERVEDQPVLEHHGRKEEWFVMQHLQLSKPEARNYLAVIRPMGPGDGRLSAELLRRDGKMIGVHINNDLCSDYLWFERAGTEYRCGDLFFRGAYGAVLQRDQRRFLWLGGEGEVQCGAFTLRSESPLALLELAPGEGAVLHARGTGLLHVRVAGGIREFLCEGEQVFRNIFSNWQAS